MPHDHPHDHNHPPTHLHSHVGDENVAAEVQALSAQFIEGFKAASDKAAFLRLAGVPLEIESEEGGGALKLIDVSVRTEWAVGAASPAFGGGGLSYMPYPGDLIKERTNCALTYVSLTERRDVDLRKFIAQSARR
ncbi:MAG: hypothetical protein MRY74_15830 [Neomegalonema sp.]|nr:hypothetical protein [Neomegalonema sp.]